MENRTRYAFHVTGQTGWINDPNGFSWYGDKIHLFFQHNPYKNTWGPMHWGHVTGTDFVKWTYEKIALSPDRPRYDSIFGAFSGSAIEFQGKYYLVYTGCNLRRQTQCIAVSDNGVDFTKYDGNPVLDKKDLPKKSSIANFRDPKVWEKGGKVYMLVSAKNKYGGRSRLLLYHTNNMTEWSYGGVVFSNQKAKTAALGHMMECPDIFTLGGTDVLIISPQKVKGHKNRDASVYVTGKLNYGTGGFECAEKNVREIDNGTDFYAPQTMQTPDGRRVMAAWMATWNRVPINALLGCGYAGALTFPRELTLSDGRLFQNPVREIERYYTERYEEKITLLGGTRYIEELSGKVQNITIEFLPTGGKTGISVFDDGKGNGLKIYYENRTVTLDRSKVIRDFYPSPSATTAVCDTPSDAKKIKLRLLMDKYSCEVFVCDGYSAMTTTVAPLDAQIKTYIFSDEEVFVTVARDRIEVK